MTSASAQFSALFQSGPYDEYYYEPPTPPALEAPIPQRIVPEMSDNISDGLRSMRLDSQQQADLSIPDSAFPRLKNPPSNIPPADEDVETTLESARSAVLESNDPNMQLAWAQDALHQIDINSDDRMRLQAMRLNAPTPIHTELQIRVDAMNIVGFLAEQRHPRAEFIKGTWWEFGKFGCRLDKKEAFRCYARSADRKYARAEYRVGMLYEASNDPVKALQHYHRGLVMGDAACLYRVGMMTLRGQHGQAQDFAHGIELIRRSSAVADENAAQGAYVYGMLLAGELEQIPLPAGFLQLDERAARIEIEKAAYLKFAKAQLRLGLAYELGELGCDFNPAYSLHYYTLAARQGEPEAEMGISKWFLVGHEGLFSKNDELAYLYAQRAALSGFPNAEFAMGYFNELGIFVPKNIDLALDWYKKAAANGNVDAHGRIKGISEKHVLSRSDHENIALHRIKSQHGSWRGVRPDRPSANNMPPVAEIQPLQPRSGDAGQPPRNSSVAPYPTGDRPPYMTDSGSLPQAAPYPPMPPVRHSIDANAGFPGRDSPRRQSGMVQPDPRQRIASNPNPMPRPISNVGPDPRSQGRRIESSPRMGYPGPAAGSPRLGFPGSSGPPRAPTASDNRHSTPSGVPTPAPLRLSPRVDSSRSPPDGPPGGRRMSSRPDLPQPSDPSIRRPSPGRAPMPDAPPQAPPKAPPKPTAAPVKPTKGPQTFEEMGVPAQKQRSDCVVM